MILLCIKRSDNPKAESKQFLCDILRECCKIENANDVIKYTEHGKPIIDGTAFSLSHSDNLLCVAVQCDSVGENAPDYLTYKIETDRALSSIGVDIECIDNKSIDRCRKIAKSKYFIAEQTTLQNADDYITDFCKMWTAKESYCKFTGVGLPDALTFDACCEHKDITIFTDIIVKDGKNYALSLCYNSVSE